MRNTSDDSERPVVLAENLGVSFLIRYHRSEVTLRETFVRMLDRFRHPENGHGRWQQRFWALRDVNLEVRAGEILGIVGRNGCGKSTLLKTLAGILGPDEGRVEVRGRIGCLMSFGVGFKPNLSGRENIFINGSILGLGQREVASRLDRIIEFSELGDFIDAPVRTYSAGMKGRLGFSIAVHIEPDVLLLDEVLTVGDASFREKAGSILDRFRDSNRTVIIASHSMNLIKERCTRAVWIESGGIRMTADAESVTAAYMEESRARKLAQAAR